MSKKVLVLGHGWYYWDQRYEPRCAPMTLEEWNEQVQNAPKECLVFLDCFADMRPDILENIGNNWGAHISEPNTFDVVIDSVGHLASGYRKSKYYWQSIKRALKADGSYIGCNDANSGISRHIRLHSNMIDEHVKRTYDKLISPKTKYPIYL